jgi:NDP-sugar pyrophosphorylase family protein
VFAKTLFSASLDNPFDSFFSLDATPWDWLGQIEHALEFFFKKTPPFPLGSQTSALSVKGDVWIHPSVSLPLYGSLEGPLYVGPGTVLRNGISLRGPLIIGPNCMIGHCSEVKASIFLSGAYAPHFNYVGDSVLGHNARLGAGAILANLRFDEAPVSARILKDRYPTGRRKCGSFLGDNVRVGCNVVLQPGTVLLPSQHLFQAPEVRFVAKGAGMPPAAGGSNPQAP